MKMERSLQLMMERLFAKQSEEMKARQEKADADAKARQEKADADAEARQEKMKAEIKANINANITAIQEKADADAKARHEEVVARQEKATVELKTAILASFRRSTTCQTETPSSSEGMDATRLEATPEETEANVITFEESSEEMDATRIEATSGATEAAVERLEILKEEINVDNIGSLVDRYEDRRLVLRRRRGAKKRIQDSVGFRQKLSAARKRVIRRAVTAVRKGNIRKGPGRKSVGRVHPKSRTFGKKQWKNSECGNVRVDRDLKKRLGLRMQRKSGGKSKKITRLEMVNIVVGSTTGVQGVNDWTFWKVRPPPKRKKELRTVRGPEAFKQRSLEY
jgi:hypothetical protein